ncbi:MAG: sel1 repeat family protein [Pseudomonadota bacterium]
MSFSVGAFMCAVAFHAAQAQDDPFAAAGATQQGSNPFGFHDLERNANRAIDLGTDPQSDATQSELERLRYAADTGNEVAMWQLGRYYAENANGSEDHARAFDMFSRLVAAEGDHSPYSPRAPYVAHALTQLGSYYREGIPGSTIEKNREAAWRMFYTAGNLYRNPNALFSLSEMCDGEGGFHCTPRQGLRWLNLAAERGHVGAQARLGYRLFEGEGIGRSPVQGLMWLTIAQERAHTVREAWVTKLHERAFSVASADQRDEALRRAEDWMRVNCADARVC